MAVYEINEAQNNANKVNTNKDLVAGYANQQGEETLQKDFGNFTNDASKCAHQPWKLCKFRLTRP